MNRSIASGRHGGVLLPLFSAASSRSWGIGEIGDIAPLADWLARASLDVLQLLPLNEMAPGQTSPYSAISAMAIDPQFISVAANDDFAELGGEKTLDAEQRAQLRLAKSAPVVAYEVVRPLKQWALRASFARFDVAEWQRETARAERFRRFITDEGWWLDDYALFRALHARDDRSSWLTWEGPLRARDPRALEAARSELDGDIRFYQYVQWVAASQWHEVRRAASAVALFGDLPFMVDLDSADVWAHQSDFDLQGAVGVPPDAFSSTGQDWGLPAYRWDEMARNDFEWLRQRARRAASLYDGFRVDHVVGFYRTYVRPRDGGDPYFTPADQWAQERLGERVLEALCLPGARIIAEDLGTVPDFVRASLARLGVPGYRVLRWEREWQEDGQPFRDPRHYPPNSVATSGTHDTEPLAIWWDTASAEERRRVGEIPTLRQIIGQPVDLVAAPFTPPLRDALLEMLFISSADLVILPLQDLFGWHDRINEPASLRSENWRYRLPWPSDQLTTQREPLERARWLRALSERSNRHPR